MEDSKQPKIRMTNAGRPVRSIDGAVEMYQRGMNATRIAIALGFVGRHGATSNGMKRVRRFLESAGVRTTTKD